MTDDNHEPPAMVPEPLPCPFCGPGNSIVEAYYDDWSKRYRVGCGCCGASTGITPRASDDSAAVAIARWNTRDGWNARAALDAPPDPELAESRREAEQCRADAEEARASMRRLQRAMQDRQTEIERLREALTAARAQGHAAGMREERERLESAIRSAPSLDENGYICEKSAVIKTIRALAAPEPQE